MLAVIRVLMRALELLVLLPFRILRVVLDRIAFNPRFGPLRYVASAATVYILFALTSSMRWRRCAALVGQYFLGDKLRYDAERWLATAVYDARGSFVGTFDPRLDSQRDVNYTDAAIDARRLRRQPRPQVDPRARGARALLAVPRLSRGPPHRRRAQPVTASTSSAC